MTTVRAVTKQTTPRALGDAVTSIRKVAEGNRIVKYCVVVTSLELLVWCFQTQSTSFFGFFFGVNGSVRKKTWLCAKVNQSINQPFIVLTETKFSHRHIPVWARYSPHPCVFALRIMGFAQES